MSHIETARDTVTVRVRVTQLLDEFFTRLDRADYENTTVRVYRIRYGNAKVLAGILREVFTGQANTASTGTSDLSQLTPGSSMQRASSSGTPKALGACFRRCAMACRQTRKPSPSSTG